MRLSIELQFEMYKLLERFKEHRGCEDGWYACPKSPDYIPHTDLNENQECGCGAEDVQKLLAKIEEDLRRSS